MKIFAIILLSLFTIHIYSQTADFDGHTFEAPYVLPTPTNWGIERFPIPIGFAPQIPYKGVEDIRFTPGWAKATSDEYWCYAFLWYLDGEVKMDSKIIESNLQLYYSGLIAANGPNIPKEKLIPVVTAFKEAAKDSNDLKTYLGTINMLNYMTQQAIVLNCKVHIKICTGEAKTFIFYELSPKPLSHTIWQNLDKLWVDFKCK